MTHGIRFTKSVTKRRRLFLGVPFCGAHTLGTPSFSSLFVASTTQKYFSVNNIQSVWKHYLTTMTSTKKPLELHNKLISLVHISNTSQGKFPDSAEVIFHGRLFDDSSHLFIHETLTNFWGFLGFTEPLLWTLFMVGSDFRKFSIFNFQKSVVVHSIDV